MSSLSPPQTGGKYVHQCAPVIRKPPGTQAGGYLGGRLLISWGKGKMGLTEAIIGWKEQGCSPQGVVWVGQTGGL